MVLPLRGDRYRVVGRHLVRADGRARHAAVAIVQLQRQDVLEGRAHEAALSKRSTTEHEQPAPALADEVGRQRELRTGEELTFDVGNEQRVVTVQPFPARRKAGDQPGRTAGPRLYEKRSLAALVLA